MRGADLAVLAVKADAALDTAAPIAAALGETPLLSVASVLGFSKDGVRPDPDARSLAERIQELVDAPVAAGLHSIAAANLAAEPPDEDAFVCGDDARREGARARARGEARRGPRARRRPARERAHARGPDRGDREPEPPLQGRTPASASPASRRVISIVPVEGLPEIEEGDDLGALIAASRRARGRRRGRRRAEGRLEGRGPRRADRRRRGRRTAARELAGDARPAPGRGRPPRDGAHRPRRGRRS